jgi:hypothetical protein
MIITHHSGFFYYIIKHILNYFLNNLHNSYFANFDTLAFDYHLMPFDIFYLINLSKMNNQ